MNRRTFLRLAAAGTTGVLGCAGRRPLVHATPRQLVRANEPRPLAPPLQRRPSYIAVLVLHGGYDSLLTFDPKLPDQVSKVDLEYRADDLLKGRERLYGPLFKPLMPFEEDLAIVHAVRVDTVGHEQATSYLARGRVSQEHGDVVIGDRVGRSLPGTAPIHHLVTGSDWTEYFLCGLECTDETIGGRSSAALLPASDIELGHPEPVYADMAEVRDARAAQAELVFEGEAHRADYEAANRNAVALGELLAQAKGYDGLTGSKFGKGLNMALEAIRLDKARYLSVVAHPNLLDTHLDNLRLQRKQTLPTLEEVATFLRLLGETRNAFGPLIEQTTVMICTEMGRFSRLNNQHGKDHWPENSWLFAGRGIKRRPGGLTIGATDEQRRARPIDVKTGAPAPNGKPVFVQSAFATLIKAAGLDPGEYGYTQDELLPCLLA